MRLPAAAVTLAVLLVVGLAAAPAAVAADPADEDAENVVDVYNHNVDSVPDVVRNRFADERVALVIERPDEKDSVYTAVTDGDARIVDLEEGERDPTMRVTTDEATVREVADSERPTKAAVDAYETDDVEVEGIGVANSVTVEATKLGYSVASSLGLL